MILFKVALEKISAFQMFGLIAALYTPSIQLLPWMTLVHPKNIGLLLETKKKDSQLTSSDTDLLTFSYNGINSTSQITVEVVPAYSCGSGYKWGNSQQWSVNGTIGTSTHFYVTTIFITYHTMLLISHTFYIVLFINNRRGGIVVERSSRMREIGVQYPYETDLSR